MRDGMSNRARASCKQEQVFHMKYDSFNDKIEAVPGFGSKGAEPKDLEKRMRKNYPPVQLLRILSKFDRTAFSIAPSGVSWKDTACVLGNVASCPFCLLLYLHHQ